MAKPVNGSPSVLIMVPYADIPSMETGTSVIAKKVKDRKTLYLKNCCVTLVSAKHQHPNCDVALVTNIEIPEPFASILEQAGVKTLFVPFDHFNFGEQFTWGLAFYKICARYVLSHTTDYDILLCLDSDIYVQDNLEALWAEANDHIVLYNYQNLLSAESHASFVDDVAKLLGDTKPIDYFGGEFVAACRPLMQAFTEREEEIFRMMQEKHVTVASGDEFITSIAAASFSPDLKDAAAYVYRFWTGSWRRISPAYRTGLPLLHVPMEKFSGMISVYDRYVAKGTLPYPDTKVWNLLHLTHRSLSETVRFMVKKCLGRQ